MIRKAERRTPYNVRLANLRVRKQEAYLGHIGVAPTKRGQAGKTVNGQRPDAGYTRDSGRAQVATWGTGKADALRPFH